MIRLLTIPMRTPAGRWLELKDLLARVPDNNWDWICLEFNGIGRAPESMTMEEFEERAVRSSSGYRFSWHDLKNFAEQVEQVHNCLFVAAAEERRFVELDRSLDEFPMSPISVCGFDNLNWEIGLADDFGEFQSLFDSFADLRT
jgi:hypothetical protein